jgi:hypothetical protein
MLNRALIESEQVTNADLFYGIWENLFILEWGYLTIILNDKTTGWEVGDVSLAVNVAIDVYCEHPASFNLATSVAKAV